MPYHGRGQRVVLGYAEPAPRRPEDRVLARVWDGVVVGSLYFFGGLFAVAATDGSVVVEAATVAWMFPVGFGVMWVAPEWVFMAAAANSAFWGMVVGIAGPSWRRRVRGWGWRDGAEG